MALFSEAASKTEGSREKPPRPAFRGGGITPFVGLPHKRDPRSETLIYIVSGPVPAAFSYGSVSGRVSQASYGSCGHWNRTAATGSTGRIRDKCTSRAARKPTGLEGTWILQVPAGRLPPGALRVILPPAVRRLSLRAERPAMP
jgi:hypothetical protein